MPFRSANWNCSAASVGKYFRYHGNDVLGVSMLRENVVPQWIGRMAPRGRLLRSPSQTPGQGVACSWHRLRLERQIWLYGERLVWETVHESEARWVRIDDGSNGVVAVHAPFMVFGGRSATWEVSGADRTVRASLGCAPSSEDRFRFVERWLPPEEDVRLWISGRHAAQRPNDDLRSPAQRGLIPSIIVAQAARPHHRMPD